MYQALKFQGVLVKSADCHAYAMNSRARHKPKRVQASFGANLH